MHCVSIVSYMYMCMCTKLNNINAHINKFQRHLQHTIIVNLIHTVYHAYR